MTMLTIENLHARVEGKDMIVLTAISTSEKQEEAAGVQKLAEEMALAFTAKKQ